MEFNRGTAADTIDRVESLMAFLDMENPKWSKEALLWLKNLRDDIDDLFLDKNYI